MTEGPRQNPFIAAQMEGKPLPKIAPELRKLGARVQRNELKVCRCGSKIAAAFCCGLPIEGLK